MGREDAITRALAITDLALREFFPDDFHKRCMYASFGMASLLNKAGINAHVIGGEFLCAVVSEDGRQLNLQGFGNRGGGPSHFWVHASEQLLDLGPMYLPFESTFKAPPPPIIRWPLSIRLPDFVTYREAIHLTHDADIADGALQERRMEFLARCGEVDARTRARALPASWQLRDYQSLRHAAERSDPWAMAAAEFLRRSLKATFPEP